MKNLVTLTIEGKKVEAPEGTYIVDAAKMAGIDIPVFCYHPKMKPVGMCRMCLVEIGRPVRDRETGDWVRNPDGSLLIQMGPKLETACTTPVTEGMVVLGSTEKAAHGRKDVIEFLLTSHPLDCPICDKGGECPLQNLTMGYGPGQSRFIYDEKFNFPKRVPLGDLIILDRERCIQCARCVRFQDEIVDDPVIGFFERGRALEIVTFSDPGFDSYFSGNTTDICPVGALTTTDFRFEARPWELNAAASICPHCPVGCNTTLNTRREARAGGEFVIKRVMPRQNEWVNEIWMCDKGRFAYHYTQSGDRLSTPMLRKDGELVPAGWEEALQVVSDRFRQAGEGLVILGGGRLANEDLFNLNQLAKGVGGKSILYSSMAGGDLTAQVGVGKGTNFSEMGAGTTILVVACDLEEEAPIWWLKVKQATERGATVIVANPRQTKTDRVARHAIRYPYGAEASTILAMINSLSAKRPDLGDNLPRDAGFREKIQAAAQAFAEAENGLVLFGSEGIGLDASQALAQACANLLITTNHVGKANNGLIAAWSAGNLQGGWDMGLRPDSKLGEVLRMAKALYIAAADPAGDGPGLAESLREAGFLVVQELFLSETARLADVVLPVQSFAEREGTYTNGERRVQRFYPAIRPRAGCLPDYAVTAEVGKLLGLDLEGSNASLVMNRIAAQVPDYNGVTYQKLAEVVEQWPIVGRQDLYYGGTTYENSQGLGVQLTSAAERGETVSLGWTQPSSIPTPAEGLLAVPVTRLYDRGTTVLPSKLLGTRIPQAHIVFNPQDAETLGINQNDLVEIHPLGDLNKWNREVTPRARLDDSVPAGIVFVPRSMGLPLWRPEAVEVRLLERVAA